jgi:hypothetical protein
MQGNDALLLILTNLPALKAREAIGSPAAEFSILSKQLDRYRQVLSEDTFPVY